MSQSDWKQGTISWRYYWMGKIVNHCLNTGSSKHVNRPMIIAFSLFSVPALTINMALSKSPHFPFMSSNLLTSLWYRFLLSVRTKIEPMTSHCNTFVDLVCSIPIFQKFVTLITWKLFESIMVVIYCTSSLQDNGIHAMLIAYWNPFPLNNVKHCQRKILFAWAPRSLLHL